MLREITEMNLIRVVAVSAFIGLYCAMPGIAFGQASEPEGVPLISVGLVDSADL